MTASVNVHSENVNPCTTKAPKAPVNNQKCDNSDGERWMKSTKQPTMEACKKSCTGKCISVTYYAHGGCDQFSTCCKKKTSEAGANAVIVNKCPVTNGLKCDNSNGERWMGKSDQTSVEKCVQKCKDTKGCLAITYYPHGGCDQFSTCCEKTVKGDNTHAIAVPKGAQCPSHSECDVTQGEVYIGSSSKKVADYDTCKKSCMDDAVCQSITYYVDGWCSHFSTPCTKTRDTPNAHAQHLKDFTTTPPPKNNFNGQECDVSKGENFIGQTSGHVADLAACKKSCDDDAECQSITFYGNDKFCSHFSTKCTKRRDVPNAHAEKLKDFKTTPASNNANHEECDVAQGEVYMHESSKIQDNYAACEKSCNDNEFCQAITYYNHGWCRDRKSTRLNSSH